MMSGQVLPGSPNEADAPNASGVESLDPQDRPVDLRLMGSTDAEERYFVGWVQAADAFTTEPIANLSITVAIIMDELDDIEHQVITDQTGTAELRLELPEITEGCGFEEWEIAAWAPEYEDWGDVQISLPRYLCRWLVMSTDRGLYRPGDTVRFRGLTGFSHGRFIPHAEAEWSVVDPKGNTVATFESTSSDHGVFHAEWALPKRARTGLYAIKIADYGTADYFLVKPYELPRFRVIPEHDGFFLADQEIRVRASVQRMDGTVMAGAAVRIRGNLSRMPLAQAVTDEEGRALLEACPLHG